MSIKQQAALPGQLSDSFVDAFVESAGDTAGIENVPWFDVLYAWCAL